MERHKLDVWPEPREKKFLYINEPWLIDEYKWELGPYTFEEDKAEDNVRVLLRYDEVNEKNEMQLAMDMEKFIAQVEIYDQVWYVRHMPKTGEHSVEAKELVQEIIKRLEEIPDGCAEVQPFELIDELKAEYLTD